MPQSVSLDSALIFNEFCHPKRVCMDSLKINQCDFHILAGTLICKFMAIPDWLNVESESDNIRKNTRTEPSQKCI